MAPRVCQRHGHGCAGKRFEARKPGMEHEHKLLGLARCYTASADVWRSRVDFVSNGERCGRNIEAVDLSDAHCWRRHARFECGLRRVSKTFQKSRRFTGFGLPLALPGGRCPGHLHVDADEGWRK